MHLRKLELAGAAAGLIIGALLVPTALQGDSAHLLGTFLGLIAASILPSISLIVASMTPGGRSVAAINRLRDELMVATAALLGLFGLVALVFAAIFMLGVEPPILLRRVPYLTDQILPRAGQAVVVSGSVMIVMRARLIPAILRRCIAIRHEIAADDAQKKTLENAGKVGEAAHYFARDPNFGRTLPLQELIDRDGS